MSAGTTALMVAIGLVIYGFIHLRLQIAVQPLRLDIAKRGEHLLASPHLNANQKGSVAGILESAYSGWMIVVFVFFIPLLTVYSVVRPATKDRWRNEYRVQHEETKDQLSILKSRYVLSIMAANPLFGIIFIVEVLLLAFIAAALTGSIEALKSALGISIQRDRAIVDRITRAWQH